METTYLKGTPLDTLEQDVENRIMKSVVSFVTSFWRKTGIVQGRH